MIHADQNTVTEVTRRAIIDYLSVGRHWSGVLQEDDFLGRLYPLSRMPSTDYRAEFNTAAKDIWKHRVMNTDWPDDWVFTDSRFDLLHGPDEAFLRFLAETVHPIVRPESTTARDMVKEFNAELAADGWELYVSKEISGRPVYGFRRLTDSAQTHLDRAKAVAERLNGSHVAQQIRRLERAVDEDPELAIGTAKEFVESLCKTILSERGITFSKNDDFPGLVRLTIREVGVVPDEIGNTGDAEKKITVLLNNLGSVGQQLAEIRNQFGTGHGRTTSHVGLERRHARLAVGAASTLVAFLYESHEANPGGDSSKF